MPSPIYDGDDLSTWKPSAIGDGNAADNAISNLEDSMKQHFSAISQKLDALIHNQCALFDRAPPCLASAENCELVAADIRWERSKMERSGGSATPQALQRASPGLISPTHAGEYHMGIEMSPLSTRTPSPHRQPGRAAPSTVSLMKSSSKTSSASGLRIVQVLTTQTVLGKSASEPSKVAVIPEQKSSSVQSTIQSTIKSERRYQFLVSQRIHQLMEQPESSSYAYWLAQTMLVINVVGVAFAIVCTIEPLPISGSSSLMVLSVLDSVFTLELLVRFLVCPNHSAFFFGYLNWIDATALCIAIPLAVSAFTEYQGEDILMQLLHSIMPVLMLLKMLRRLPKFDLLTGAFVLAAEAMPVLLFTLSLIIVSFSALLYLVEPQDSIESLPAAARFVLATTLTGWNQDFKPNTVLGEFVIGFLILCRYLYLAMPLGIIGGSFNTVWEDRDRIMLKQCTRKRLLQWGYTSKDIPELFYAYNSDKSGELDLREFSNMICEMQIGIKEDRTVKLFKLFDTNESGTITSEKFMRTLFPKAYIKMYGSDGDASVHERLLAQEI